MAHKKYLPGQIVGNNNVFFLEELPPLNDNGRKRRYGKFICPICHNVFECRLETITKNHGTKSCGCLHKESMKKIGQKNKKDITGMKKGHLTAIKSTEYKAHDNSYIWEFQCDCGRKHYLPISEFTSGKTQSCGCATLSHGEQKIIQILNKHHINYQREKTFSDCISNKGGKLRFDFYLPDYNCCIEYDGEQHFQHNSATYFFDSLNNIQERDMLKNQYCKEHNIKLIRISYKDYNNLNYKYLIQKGLLNG